MSLVLPNLSYDRAAIMRSAWDRFRTQFDKPGMRSHHPFGHFLSIVWGVARAVRSRMADGSLQREKAEYEADQRRQAEALANETPEQAARAWAIIVRGCSTDGRSINSPLYR